MVTRTLVTTALEETWPKNKPILLLGEWCRRYSRKAQWENLDAKVLPYHWDDRQKLFEDYQYLQDVYEKLLQVVSLKLNEIHQVDHDIRYWRILVGPWLAYFSQILFDRWFCIQEAVTQFDIKDTLILDFHKWAFVPQDMNHFIKLLVGDEWNHAIYAAVLQQYTSVNCLSTASNKYTTDIPLSSRTIDLKNQLKSISIKLYSRIMYVFARRAKYFFLSTYLPRRVEFRLLKQLRQIPQLWFTKNSLLVNGDQTYRRWKLRLENPDKFEQFLCMMIPLQLPRAYLEGYQQLRDNALGLYWPQSPHLIWTSNRHNADDIFKIWAAEKTKHSASLVIGQHGGHYGIGKWSFVEEHELAICDRYLSWGWENTNQPKVSPVGQFKVKVMAKTNFSKRSKILLVTTTVPRYSYHMYSVIVSKQWIDYHQDQHRFVENLPYSIHEQLIIRLHHDDYGWDQELRWRDCFPKLTIDNGRTSMEPLLQQTRIYISTYNATTYLESFSLDIPTVIFWNPKHWELRDSAIPYFEDLKRVGIFHETPESAAEHVRLIWDNVDEWWSSEPVREVLTRFKKNYCHLPKNLLGHLKIALRTVFSEENS